MLWESGIFVPKFIVILPIAVKIFKSGSTWWTNRMSSPSLEPHGLRNKKLY